MTELRKRMIECLQLRGLRSELRRRTSEPCANSANTITSHQTISPRQNYGVLPLPQNVKHYARSSSTITICGIRFFFGRTLEKDWTIFNLVRPAPEKKLPVILSLSEVRQILSRLRLPRYKVCLTTIYSCGLRLQEGTNLHVATSTARLMIHVRPRQGRQRPLCPAAATHAAAATRVLAYPSQSTAALSFA